MTVTGEPSFPYPLGVSARRRGQRGAVLERGGGGDVFHLRRSGAETRHPLTLSGQRHLARLRRRASAPGQEYGFRVDGPYIAADRGALQPGQAPPRSLRPLGHRQPGVEAVVERRRAADSDAPDPTDSAPDAPRSVVVAEHLRLGRRHPPRARPGRQRHLRAARQGLHRPTTRTCPAADQGTYAGLAHPAVIAYLQGLGVTAVELLPVHQSLTNGVLAGEGLSNYWGYDTIGFFALHGAYSSARRAGGPPGSEIDEFKAMVKALHARRDRGHPRRGLQSHRRGQRAGTDAVLPGHRQRRLLPTRPRPAAVLRQPHRAAATPSTPPARRSAG